mmetsp:Transcript_86197/g.129180  ORF Transcript_86197/g.129180 Transcript_86197/m.129180 type:complete len:207 (-) Transcript_86197:878-1498(-)
MPRIIQRHGRLMDPFARPDTRRQLFDLGNQRQSFSCRKVGSVRNVPQFLRHPVAHPQRSILRSRTRFDRVGGQQSPRQRPFVDPIQGPGPATGHALRFFLRRHRRRFGVEIVGGLVLIQQDGMFRIADVVFVVESVHDEVGTNAMSQQVGEGGQESLESTTFLFADFVFVECHHAIQVARTVDDAFPDFASFGEALVGRVGLEDQE